MIGMGGGIILLGVMAVIIPEGYMVIALHGIIQLVSNTTRSYIFRNHLKSSLIKQFSLGALVGLFIAGIIIVILIQIFQVDSANEIKVEFLKPIIGIFIIWYLFFKSKEGKQIKSFIGVGGLSGVSTVFIGATGPLIAPFFLQESLTKENIIANKAACQAVTHIGKIPLFIIFFNVHYIEQYHIFLPLVLAVYIGTNFGKMILGIIPEHIFKILFKSALLIIAVKLILSNIL